MRTTTPETLAMKTLALRLFAEGHTYAAIGVAIGKTRQYAQQLVRPSPAILQAVKQRAKGKCERCSISVTRPGEAHVHHLDKGITDTSDDLKRIVLLCRSCHAAENRKLEPHKFEAFLRNNWSEMEKRFDEALANHCQAQNH